MSSTMHTNFIQVKIHTAKCDTCDNHNTLIIYRCADCGTQCCTPCWQARGGDDNHVLNGGDRGWTGETSSKTGKEKPRAAPKTGKVGRPNKNSSEIRPQGVSKRRSVRNRKAVVVDEGETEAEVEAYEKKSPAKRKVNNQRSEKQPRQRVTQTRGARQQQTLAKVPPPSITESANYLLSNATAPTTPTLPSPQSLQSPPHTPTPTPREANIFAADERGIDLLLEASAYIERSSISQRSTLAAYPTHPHPLSNVTSSSPHLAQSSFVSGEGEWRSEDSGGSGMGEGRSDDTLKEEDGDGDEIGVETRARTRTRRKWNYGWEGRSDDTLKNEDGDGDDGDEDGVWESRRRFTMGGAGRRYGGFER